MIQTEQNYRQFKRAALQTRILFNLFLKPIESELAIYLLSHLIDQDLKQCQLVIILIVAECN